jgi:predicted helicase
LNDNKLATIDFTKLDFDPPQYFFVQKDFGLKKEYDKGFSVQELFTINSVGIVTARDHFTIHQTPQKVENTIKKFMSLDDETARKHFELGADVRDWQIALAKKDLQTSGLDFKNKIVPINYRPFDTRFTYFTGKSKGFLCMPRGEVMKQFLNKNIGLVFCRQVKTGENYCHIFLSDKVFESCLVSNRTSEIGYGFPLYLYSESKDLFSAAQRTPNLNMEIVGKIAAAIGKRFTPEKERDKTTFAPIDILDYIYALLHTPQYRTRYKEFLKIDFPRVPYPKNAAQWQTLVQKGAILRGLHLLESDDLDDLLTTYPEDGDNVVTKPRYDEGKVWLNATQYFGGVTESVWHFYIGGYQPAQKWLKDRAGRPLNFEDIMHYQKMITALHLTEKVMGELEAYGIDFSV